MPTIVSNRTMSEVVKEMGVRKPNCAGISTEVFLSELSDVSIADRDNNARQICSRCEDRPECPIALGKASIATLLAKEVPKDA